jgi:hypothetical protein
LNQADTQREERLRGRSCNCWEREKWSKIIHQQKTLASSNLFPSGGYSIHNHREWKPER